VRASLELCDGCDIYAAISTWNRCEIYVEQIRATIRALGKVPVATLSETAQAELVRAVRDLRGPTATA
jgi:glutamyl-tRNA reductase